MSCRADRSRGKWDFVYCHLVQPELEVGGETLRALGALERTSFGIVHHHVALEATAQPETAITGGAMVVVGGQRPCHGAGKATGSAHHRLGLLPIANYGHTGQGARCGIGFDVFGR